MNVTRLREPGLACEDGGKGRGVGVGGVSDSYDDADLSAQTHKCTPAVSLHAAKHGRSCEMHENPAAKRQPTFTYVTKGATADTKEATNPLVNHICCALAPRPSAPRAAAATLELRLSFLQIFHMRSLQKRWKW